MSNYRRSQVYDSLIGQFNSLLDGHIAHITTKFRVQEPEMASALCAATFDFGNSQAFLWQAFHAFEGKQKPQCDTPQITSDSNMESEDPKARREVMQQYWMTVDERTDLERASSHSTLDSTTEDASFSGSHDAAFHGCHSFGLIVTTVVQRIGDKNVLSFVHVILAYLLGLATSRVLLHTWRVICPGKASLTS